jgi:ATP-dependent RNA helicase RhlE
VLHSNRTQREREQALRGFREGKYEVLVATDIASRGLDIADVSHVVN